MDAPAVAVHADGRKVAMGWMDMRNGRQDRDVWWRTLEGGKLGAETALAENKGGSQGHVSLAFDDAGVCHAAWASEGKVVVCTSKAPKNEILDDGAFPGVVVRGDLKIVVYESGRRVLLRKPFP
jgi:hypothetical protein